MIQFRYLGSLISEDGYCIKDIPSRIEMAKKVFMEKRNRRAPWKNRICSTTMKLRKSLVNPVTRQNI